MVTLPSMVAWTRPAAASRNTRETMIRAARFVAHFSSADANERNEMEIGLEFLVITCLSEVVRDTCPLSNLVPKLDQNHTLLIMRGTGWRFVPGVFPNPVGG